jgi:hypothetical protein
LEPGCCSITPIFALIWKLNLTVEKEFVKLQVDKSAVSGVVSSVAVVVYDVQLVPGWDALVDVAAVIRGFDVGTFVVA